MITVNIGNNNNIDKKLDMVIELLNPQDKILIDAQEIDVLTEALNNYFNTLQKQSLCENNDMELPEGTHEILDHIEKFNSYYKSLKKEASKNKLYNILNHAERNDNFFQ